jgi:hypothetical protein
LRRGIRRLQHCLLGPVLPVAGEDIHLARRADARDLRARRADGDGAAIGRGGHCPAEVICDHQVGIGGAQPRALFPVEAVAGEHIGRAGLVGRVAQIPRVHAGSQHDGFAIAGHGDGRAEQVAVQWRARFAPPHHAGLQVVAAGERAHAIAVGGRRQEERAAVLAAGLVAGLEDIGQILPVGEMHRQHIDEGDARNPCRRRGEIVADLLVAGTGIVLVLRRRNVAGVAIEPVDGGVRNHAPVEADLAQVIGSIREQAELPRQRRLGRLLGFVVLSGYHAAKRHLAAIAGDQSQAGERQQEGNQGFPVRHRHLCSSRMNDKGAVPGCGLRRNAGADHRFALRQFSLYRWSSNYSAKFRTPPFVRVLGRLAHECARTPRSCPLYRGRKFERCRLSGHYKTPALAPLQ